MYLWEMVAHRLRMEGWSTWHWTNAEEGEPTFVVQVHGRGLTHRVHGPTLTEAYAEAARQVRTHRGGALAAGPAPPLGLGTLAVK